VRNILPLQSFYSQRIYELLKQYSRIGERRMAVDDLREILRLSIAYDHYGSFKKRVILQAQRELVENTDLSFEFTEIKTGRKVTHLHFRIEDRSLRSQRETIPGNNEPATPALVNILTTEFGLSRAQAEDAVKCHAEDYIIENLGVVRKRFGLGQVKNLAPYTLKALEKDFRTRASKLEQEQASALKESQEALRAEEDARAAEEALLQDFEDARSIALNLATADLGAEELVDGFEPFIREHHRFAYDYVRKHKGDLLANLDHAMIRPIYHQFLAQKLLPAKFHSFEAWCAE
jgi:plasmid replication initiation protein